MKAEVQTIATLADTLRRREISSEQATTRCLARIDELNRSLNAFITVTGDTALEQARAADRELAAGVDRGPLHGVPISLKDLVDLQGTATTAASRVRAGHVATADALIVTRLREAGAVVVGKTNLHEFALGTTNEDSAYGPARHPLNPERSPGGSSGGSAVAVATGMSYASIGTDTGGSIRIPAAICGLVGLKPSVGEVPTDGVVPLSTTLDHVGPLALSVGDARVVYEAVMGQAGRLPSTALRPGKPAPTKALRLGIPREYFFALLDPEVASAFETLCERLRAAGVTLDEVRIPHAADLAPIYTHIVLSEAAAYHAPALDTRPDDYTPNVRARLEMGRYILAEDYVRALRGRAQLQREVDAALDGRDGLLLPSVAVPATRIGEPTVRIGSIDEPVRNITLRLTQLFSVTGHPAISMPCGTTRDGLPVGAQIAGHTGATMRLLDLAETLEPYVGPGRSR